MRPSVLSMFPKRSLPFKGDPLRQEEATRFREADVRLKLTCKIIARAKLWLTKRGSQGFPPLLVCPQFMRKGTERLTLRPLSLVKVRTAHEMRSHRSWTPLSFLFLSPFLNKNRQLQDQAVFGL